MRGQLLNVIDRTDLDVPASLNHTRRKFLARLAASETVGSNAPSSSSQGNIVSFTLEGLRLFQATSHAVAVDLARTSLKHDGTKRRPNYNNQRRRLLAKQVDRVKHLSRINIFKVQFVHLSLCSGFGHEPSI